MINDQRSHQIDKLRQRINKLSMDKANLQIIEQMITRLAPLKGIREIIHEALQMMSNIMGGNNIRLYYHLAEGWKSMDLNMQETTEPVPADPLVRKTIEFKKRQVEGETSVPETTSLGSLNVGYFMTNTDFANADNPEILSSTPHMSQALPLKVKNEVIGVIKFEGMMVNYAHLTSQLENMCSYLALLLKNELTNTSLLEKANKSLSIQNKELLQTKEDLKTLNSRLEGKNRELEQIVYIASHDLRSPLVNIDGYGKELDLLVDEMLTLYHDIPQQPDDIKSKATQYVVDIKESLKYIRNSTSRMDALLKGMLKMSRLGRAALTVVPINMNQLVQSTLASLDFNIKSSQTDLVVEDLPPCAGDQFLLSQVISNLIVNALKYSSPKRKGIIRIFSEEETDRVVYVVEDNGIGISPEYQEKIFEPFHRLAPSCSEGEGLGLTIVRKAMDRLGGDVWVKSSPDQGCRFYIAMPKSTFSSNEELQENDK